MSNAQQFILAGIAFMSGFVICGVLTLIPGFLPDVPNFRSLHRKPIPRGGGLAFFLPSILVLLIVLWQTGTAGGPLMGLALCASATAVLGLVDDVRRLPASVRLLIQGLITTAGAWIFLPPAFSILDLIRFTGSSAHVFQVIWILASINLYNFMDGMDGMAGMQALWASTILTLLLYLEPLAGQPAVRVFFFAASASVCGFLIWNLPPARIFMGDVGSYFLGFVLAYAPLAAAVVRPGGWFEFHASPERPPLLNLVSVCSVLLPFLLDSTTTLLRRITAGHNPFEAHKDHVYQKLVRIGWPAGRVILLYLLLNSVSLVPILAQIFGARPVDVFLLFMLVMLSGFVLFFSLSKALDGRIEMAKRAAN